jgi:multiple antibiotic resistance protein
MAAKSVWISFLLAFTALLPLINPIGSALIFLGLVGDESVEVYRQLARKISVATVLFLIIIEFLGSLLLSFFGISLPVVQVTGGVVIAATAWSLLFENDARENTRKKHAEIGDSGSEDDSDLAGKIFYPFTFPITAGPGTLVVMLTLSARVSNKGLTETTAGHAGIVLATAVLCTAVYFCYAYAPKLIKAISPSTVHGILRVIAFILMCIGVQIAWNGISMLAATLAKHG